MSQSPSDPIQLIKEALGNAKAEIVSRVDPNTETSMTLDDIDEALALLSPAPTCAAIVPPGNGYGPITSITLGDKFIGRITEAEAVELVNAVINSQLEISSGLQTMASGPADLPALKKRCYAHFFDCEPSKVDEENDGDYIHVINQIVDFLAPLLGMERAGGDLEALRNEAVRFAFNLDEPVQKRKKASDYLISFINNLETRNLLHPIPAQAEKDGGEFDFEELRKRVVRDLDIAVLDGPTVLDYLRKRNLLRSTPSPQGDARVKAADEIKKLREIIINLTNAAALVISEIGESHKGYFLRNEVKIALRDAGIKEGDEG